ncbi:ECF transporter S component [Mycobacterium sp. DSM 3803]|nr:ECF transporter S component [Mycobacterium sp. DSM 3803]OKH77714.1 membrane protein [Mycobacterium sp. SWH-M3]
MIMVRWRVVDIVVASVLAVAAGLVFVFWNIASNPLTAPLTALLPGLQALAGGGWLFAGVLTALVIRKPGAALYGEVVAATVSALVGNQWGVLTIESGLVQGLGAELVFAIFLYRRWNLPVAALAGAAAGLALAINDLILWYPGSTTAFAAIYTVSAIVSGTVIAGVLSWYVVKALAKTGALSRFDSGRAVPSSAPQ